MALDSYRAREIRKPTEEVKIKDAMHDIKQLNRIIDSLPTSDIDQQWVKENEGKEFSFAIPTSNNDDARMQEVFAKMEKIGAFGSTTRKQNTTPQTLAAEPTNDINASSQNVLAEKEPSVSESVTPAPKEKQEEIIVNNSSLIEELNSRIDKKYNRLVQELANLYNSEVINQEANSIKSDLQRLMEIKDRSVEELKKIDDALNNLISKFAKLAQKADEIKTTDDFRITQQREQLNTLINYQNGLERKYGKYWFGKMTDEEKEQYINFYAFAHKVSREIVEKQIEDSIMRAYDDIIAERKQNAQSQNQNVNNDSQLTQPFKGNYEETIRLNGHQALETMKQIYSNLHLATQEQIEEFNYLYNALSTLSKYVPNNYEEENQKLAQLYDLTARINKLNNSLSNIASVSR